MRHKRFPGFEVFFMDAKDQTPDTCFWHEGAPLGTGWFWWFCMPGCMPDGDPQGPFETEQAAWRDLAEDLEVEAETEA